MLKIFAGNLIKLTGLQSEENIGLAILVSSITYVSNGAGAVYSRNRHDRHYTGMDDPVHDGLPQSTKRCHKEIKKVSFLIAISFIILTLPFYLPFYKSLTNGTCLFKVVGLQKRLLLRQEHFTICGGRKCKDCPVSVMILIY